MKREKRLYIYIREVKCSENTVGLEDRRELAMI